MPDTQTPYEQQLAALKTSVQSLVQAVLHVRDNATTAENALKLNGLTYEQIVENIMGATSMTIADLQLAFNEFTERTDNPNNVTKEQVGLGLVENMATMFKGDLDQLAKADIVDIDDQYTTVAGAYWLAEKAILQITNNAPETLDTINEIAEALQNNPDIITIIQEQVNGKATKAELADAITNLTKASVGLENVENWAPATALEAMDPAVADKYMTPATTHLVADAVRDELVTMMEELADEIAAGAALITADPTQGSGG